MDKPRRGSGNCPSESLPEQQSPPHRLPLPSSCFSLAGVLHTGDNTFLKWLGIRQERNDCNPGYSEDEAAGSLSLTSSRSVWALRWDLVSKQKQLWLEILEESNYKSLSDIVPKRNTPAMSLTSPFFLSFSIYSQPSTLFTCSDCGLQLCNPTQDSKSRLGPQPVVQSKSNRNNCIHQAVWPCVRCSWPGTEQWRMRILPGTLALKVTECDQ